MNRNGDKTYRELIESALKSAGWVWDRRLHLGPGRVNISGGSMHDNTQRIVPDHVLRLSRLPLAILKSKAEDEEAADGIQQGQQLGLRFSIATIPVPELKVQERTAAKLDEILEASLAMKATAQELAKEEQIPRESILREAFAGNL